MAEADARAAVEKLQLKLKEKEALLHRAGQYGNELMEQNRELTESLEDCNAEFTKKIEVLREENYSLTQKVEQKSKMELEYQEEIESLKKHSASQREELRVLSELKDQTFLISQLKQRLREVEGSNDLLELEKKQLSTTLTSYEIQLADLNEKLISVQETMNETAGDEVAVLARRVSQLESVTDELKCNCDQMQSEKDQLQQQVDTIQCHVTSLQAELQDTNEQLVSLSNSFMSSTQENQELRCEIDVLRLNNETHKKKGNSMFSELDDKRQEAEKRLLALSVQHETLRNQHDLSKKQLQKLKMQMSVVLQMSSGQVDCGHVYQLENQLAQARNELHTANTRLSQISISQEDSSSLLQLSAAAGSSSDVRTLQYVQALLRTKEEELATANEELQLRRLRTSEDLRSLADTQQKLRVAESRNNHLHAQNIKLGVKLDELRQKLHEESEETDVVLQKGHIEEIPGFNAEMAASVQHHLVSQAPVSLETYQRKEAGSAISIEAVQCREDNSEGQLDTCDEVDKACRPQTPSTSTQDIDTQPLVENNVIYNHSPFQPVAAADTEYSPPQSKPEHWLVDYAASRENLAKAKESANSFDTQPQTKTESKVIKVKSVAESEEVNKCNTQ